MIGLFNKKFNFSMCILKKFESELLIVPLLVKQPFKMLSRISHCPTKLNFKGFGARFFSEAAAKASTEFQQTVSNQAKQDSVESKILEKLTKPDAAVENAQPQQPPKPTIEELEEQVKNLKNQNLYLLADVENSRRRFERLARELENTAITSMAKQLLPVADNIRRIIDTGDKQTVKSIYEAVGIVDSELHNIFKTFKIERLNSKGVKFNPEFHDAIATIPGKQEESGNVVDVITEGYTLADKLLRAAKVVVAK